MLGARDDFLSGVAALGEADRVQQVEIQHLRDEGLAGGRVDLRQSGADVREPPFILHTLRLAGIDGGKGLWSCDEPVAVRVASDRRYAHAIGFGVAAARKYGAAGRYGTARGHGTARRRYGEAAAHGERIAGVLDLDLGTHDKLAHALHG